MTMLPTVKLDKDSKASLYLDFIRAVAAILVLMNHLRSLLYVNFSDLTRPGPLMKAFYLVTALGHQAVAVFFVLSGFLIAGNVLRAIEKSNWTWKTYLTHRFVRLYVVLIPALAIGFFWDRLGMSLFSKTHVYEGLPNVVYSLGFSTVARETVGGLFGNLLFLQNINFLPFGSNVPLWSLSNEFWYYIVFPFMALALLGRLSTVSRIAAVAACVLLCYFARHVIVDGYAIWLCGIPAILVPKLPKAWKAVRTASVPLCSLLVMVTMALPVISSKVPLWPIGIAMGLLVYAIVSVFGDVPAETAHIKSRLTRSLAGSSYSLYLLHFPLATFCCGAIYALRGDRFYPGPISLIGFVLIAVAFIAYASLVASVTEGRTTQVRDTVTRLLDRKAPVGSRAVEPPGLASALVDRPEPVARVADETRSA